MSQRPVSRMTTMSGLNDFHLTRHAMERALDMGVEGYEIRETLLNPIRVTPAKSYPGIRNFRGEHITCAVDEENRVQTILWSTSRGWRLDLKNKPAYGGREFRG